MSRYVMASGGGSPEPRVKRNVAASPAIANGTAMSATLRIWLQFRLIERVSQEPNFRG
jgi:hypothetical protein